MGPGSGARWLPRRRAVLVFGGRRERVTGGDAANSVSGDTRPEARRIPGSGAVHRRGRSRRLAPCLALRADRLGIVGHSRGGGETLQYLLAIGNVQAAVLRTPGHGYRPVTRVAEFNVPMLILHGTADGPADGGGVNTQVALVRNFESALRQNRKPVEAHYYEGGGHNTFFTNSTQHDDELKTMITFLRRHLGG